MHPRATTWRLDDKSFTFLDPMQNVQLEISLDPEYVDDLILARTSAVIGKLTESSKLKTFTFRACEVFHSASQNEDFVAELRTILQDVHEDQGSAADPAHPALANDTENQLLIDFSDNVEDQAKVEPEIETEGQHLDHLEVV